MQLVLLSAPLAAKASCALAADLATLHSAYSDLLQGANSPRADIGRFVINRDLTATSEDDLIEALNTSGFFESMEQLSPILDDMASLAQRPDAPLDVSRHLENIEGLANTLRGTGCFETPLPEVGRPEDEESLELSPLDASSGDDHLEIERSNPLNQLIKTIEYHAPWSYGAMALGLIILVGVSWFVRIRLIRSRARSYPRVPFGGTLPITDSLGRTTKRVVVDISQGGLMIERPKNTPNEIFESATVRLPTGLQRMSLMWENAHFLGYRFDAPIDQSEFEAVLALEVVRPQSTGSQNANSAPEGAAEQAG